MPALNLARRDPRANDRRPDPAVLPARAGLDYALIAHTNWIDAQLTAYRVRDAETTLVTVSGRLERGRLWLREHGPSNPLHRRAVALHAELDRRLSEAAVGLQAASRACWWFCCATYAALCHVADRALWLRTVASGRFDGTSPRGVWAAVLPGRTPPGSWPSVTADAYVTARLAWTETWQLDELRAMLAREREQA